MPVQLRSGARRGRANPNPSTKSNQKSTRKTNPTIDPPTEGPVTRGRAKKAAVAPTPAPAPARGGRKKKACDEKPPLVTGSEEKKEEEKLLVEENRGEKKEEVGERKMDEFDSAGRSGDKGNAAVGDEGSNTPLPETVSVKSLFFSFFLLFLVIFYTRLFQVVPLGLMLKSNGSHTCTD